MSFQIRNSEGEAISIKRLDNEAFEFWATGESQSNQFYASPVKYEEGKYNRDIEYTKRVLQLNWFDRIGGAIHNTETTGDWGMAKEKILEPWLKHFKADEVLENPEFDEDVNSFMRLISHWESLGYKPFYIKD
jgi:hypothetical protein